MIVVEGVSKTYADGQPAAKPKDITQLKVEKSCSRGMGAWLASHKISLAITSYQTGRVYLIGSDPNGRVSFFERIFERAMGIVGNAQRIYLGGLYQLWRFENALRRNQVIHKVFDRCYVPRNAQTIGDLDIHELGIRNNGKVVFVNTKYSCLAELDPVHSFKAVWKPTFISKLAPEDRCHLNGLAMKDGEPKYVTAVCKSDSVDGWRDRRADGGVVIDVETDEIVCEGLSMPHSPRWHNGKLWVLNAGTGYLGWVDFESKRFVPFTFCPGFLRGLSMIGNVAAVGLSKPRNGRFAGLALDEELKKIGSAAGFYDDSQNGRDPAGITTQDPELSKRLDPVEGGAGALQRLDGIGKARRLGIARDFSDLGLVLAERRLVGGLEVAGLDVGKRRHPEGGGPGRKEGIGHGKGDSVLAGRFTRIGGSGQGWPLPHPLSCD